MGKRLEAVFGKAILDIEKAQDLADDDHSNALDQAIGQLVTDILALPKREVPVKIRAFFEEWQKRTNAMQEQVDALGDAPMDENASDAEKAKSLGGLRSVIESIKDFKLWIAVSAPASIPSEIMSTVKEALDGIVVTLEYMLSEVEAVEASESSTQATTSPTEASGEANS